VCFLCFGGLTSVFIADNIAWYALLPKIFLSFANVLKSGARVPLVRPIRLYLDNVEFAILMALAASFCDLNLSATALSMADPTRPASCRILRFMIIIFLMVAISVNIN
jgi:hypothetical protein